MQEQGGHQCVVVPFRKVEEREDFLKVELLLNDLPVDCDLYVFQMPLSRVLYGKMRELQKLGAKCIVELDDDLRRLPDYNPAKRNVAPPVGKPGDNNWVILDYCVRHADAVTVATPALAESYASVAQGPIFVLRNMLDWRMWQDVVPVYDRVLSPRKRVRVGYLGNLFWHKGDLEVLKPWFADWLKANPNVDFVAAGDSRVHDFLGVPEGQRVSTATLSFRNMDLPDIVATMDVGLVPLADGSFNECKSHLKGMEYAACGIPAIASPSESYRDYWFRRSGVGCSGWGFLAGGPDEWVYALDCLASDGELRRRMGMKARQVAEENTVQRNWSLWERVYEQVCSSYPVAA